MTYPPATVQTVLPILPTPSLHGRELDWLRAMVVDPDIALNYLETAGLHLTLRYLYQHFFPLEFRLSTASRYWNDEQHSEEELEFFDLIHDRLFYLPIDGDDSLCTGIPVYSINPNGWEEGYDWNELNRLEQLLIALSEQVDWEMVEATVPDVLLPMPLPPRHIDWRVFKQNCEASTVPLNYFFDTVQIFDRDTGNPFIDFCEEQFVDYWTWCVEAIEELTQFYRKANQLLQQSQLLADWLTEHPDRLVQLIELWNRSARSSPITPSVRTISASELTDRWTMRRT